MSIFRKSNERFIYKYMPINLYTVKSLVNNELYFNFPDEFNDPLDCKFRLKVEPPPSLDSARKFYISENLSEKEIERKIAAIKEDSQILQNDIEESYVRNLRKDFLISCFSENHSSVLMWSHYADRHRGICLKFDWKVHEEYFMGYKVQYSNKLPEVIYDGKGSLDSTSIFLTKITHWEYEAEVRAIVKNENGLQLAAFNPKALTGIIFGEKINESDRDMILKIINGNLGYKNIQLLDSKINPQTISVDIIE